MKQTIRIIGGLYRGKKLHFPEVEGLRPTPDRVRETLFNWLMHDIKESRCLDAFAGSGALGFEAFSRGATQVTFVEYSDPIHAHLKKTLHQFNSPNLMLTKADTRLYFQQQGQPFDIIFLDPPFSHDYIPQCMQDIVQNTWIRQGGLLYVESPAAISVDTEQWQALKLKKAGQVIYSLFRKL